MTKCMLWLLRVLRWIIGDIANDMELQRAAISKFKLNAAQHKCATPHKNTTTVLITLYTVLIRMI